MVFSSSLLLVGTKKRKGKEEQLWKKNRLLLVSVFREKGKENKRSKLLFGQDRSAGFKELLVALMQ